MKYEDIEIGKKYSDHWGVYLVIAKYDKLKQVWADWGINVSTCDEITYKSWSPHVEKPKPADFIVPVYKWVAMDDDGQWHAYEDEPDSVCQREARSCRNRAQNL